MTTSNDPDEIRADELPGTVRQRQAAPLPINAGGVVGNFADSDSAMPYEPSELPVADGTSASAEPSVAVDRPNASTTPAGKVKASFNLLPEDIGSLRTMAKRLGTTVTNILQRSIRDERFIQDELAEGNRFAVIDPRGTAREIIWR